MVIMGRQNDEYRGDRYGIQPKRKPNGKGGRWAEKRHRERRWMSYAAAKSTTQQKSLAKSRQDYFRWHDSYKPVGIPKQPQNVYTEEWENWNVFLNVENTFDGFDRKFGQKYNWREFWEAVKHVQSLHLGSRLEYLKLHREGGIPKDIPMAPDELPLWKDKWSSVGWNGFLGKTLTTQLIAIKNVQQLLCICTSLHYPSNVLEIIIAKEGIVSLEDVLKSRSDLQVIKTYVYEEHLIGRFHQLVDQLGSKQDAGKVLFNNVNMFMSELSNEFLLYRPAY